MKLASKINSLYIRLYQDWKCCDSPRGHGAHRHLDGLVKLLLREIDHRTEVEIIKGKARGARYRSQLSVLREVEAIIRDAKAACK